MVPMTVTALTDKQLEHIARLANLVLEKKEEEVFAPQLAAILDFISRLQQIPLIGVEETSQVTGLTNVFREDEIDASRRLTQDEALSQAKKTYNGFFVVPAIFEEQL